MRRTRRVKRTTLREDMIRNVLSYHKPLKAAVHYMSNAALEALIHPTFREDLERKNRY